MESNPSKEPIRSIEDFEGVKMRVPQGMGSELLTRLGASTVSMPGSEVFSALDKGVIDATDWGTLGMNNQLGLHKIAKYELYPGFYTMPAADFAVNLDAWNALTPEQQALIEMAVRDLNYDMINRLKMQDIEVANSAEEIGLTLIDWPEEERERFRTEARKVWKEWSEKSDLAKRVYDSHMAFLDKLDLLDEGQAGQ
jgi:TRAP-type mannitol/chloroaromatic compound transport system substrate-binding protein